MLNYNFLCFGFLKSIHVFSLRFYTSHLHPIIFSWKGFGVDPERDLGSVGAIIQNNNSAPTFLFFIGFTNRLVMTNLYQSYNLKILGRGATFWPLKGVLEDWILETKDFFF